MLKVTAKITIIQIKGYGQTLTSIGQKSLRVIRCNIIASGIISTASVNIILEPEVWLSVVDVRTNPDFGRKLEHLESDPSTITSSLKYEI